MPALYVIVGFLVVQRLAELGLARRDQRALASRGAIEVGRGHYPAMVALHAGWLLALASARHQVVRNHGRSSSGST